jgi:hypothetical protein
VPVFYNLPKLRRTLKVRLPIRSRPEWKRRIRPAD